MPAGKKTVIKNEFFGLHASKPELFAPSHLRRGKPFVYFSLPSPEMEKLFTCSALAERKCPAEQLQKAREIVCNGERKGGGDPENGDVH